MYGKILSHILGRFEAHVMDKVNDSCIFNFCVDGLRSQTAV